MSYAAKVLADSESKEGVRLLTVEVTFPRFILAEVNTHRVFSRNSASSRAIPTEKIIERVMEHPFIPETFNKRVKGMGVGAALEGNDVAACKEAWLDARDFAVRQATILMERDVDKSRVNRLLEPFMWHTAIITATEWDNFFALRDHKAAQPEFRITAGLMLDAMRASVPTLTLEGQWHLPLCSEDEIHACSTGKVNWEFMVIVSAGRCARVSFDRAGEFEPIQDSHDRATRLKESGHLSPFEHPATPGEGHANFRGWVQLREMLLFQDNFGILEGRQSWDQ